MTQKEARIKYQNLSKEKKKAEKGMRKISKFY